MKKSFLMFLFTILFLLVSCQKPPIANTPVDTDADTVADTAHDDLPKQRFSMWQVELLSAELADSLTATMAAVQYNGDMLETQSEIKPPNGYTFLLLHLTIEKIGVGKATFSWTDAYIQDSDGNKYYRHPNDTFLANLNIPRLKGTDIVFGTESGFACFEIPKAAERLRFIADGGDINIEVQP